jgi:hypothetical protein
MKFHKSRTLKHVPCLPRGYYALLFWFGVFYKLLMDLVEQKF